MATDEDYEPTAEFQEDTRDPLLEIPLTDSTELWLIQCPTPDQFLDFDGREVTLKSDHVGQLGSFESSSGKSYEVVSYDNQDPDATVFLPSASESKVVGKISRRVSLVRFPEPSELEEARSKRRTNKRHGGTFMTPTKSCKQSGSMMRPSPSRMQSTLFNSEEEPSSKRFKNRHVRVESASRSYKVSDGLRNDATCLGSAGKSSEKGR